MKFLHASYGWLRQITAVGITALLIAAFLTASSLFTSPAANAQTTAPDAISRAGAYLVSQLKNGDHLEAAFGNESITADGLLALAATDDPTFSNAVAAMGKYLRDHAAEYAKAGAEAAAKLTLVAHATQVDPTDFGGVDLVKLIQKGINADGSVGNFPMAYSSGLVLAALKGSEANVEPKLISWLVAQQGTNGAFSYSKGGDPDPDNTALAIVGLHTDPNTAEKQALNKAVKWALKNQLEDGFWEGMSPANSTAVLGMALNAIKESFNTASATQKAASWLQNLQLSDGGFPTSPDSDSSDLLATTQGLLFLSGKTYLDISTSSSTTPSSLTPTAATLTATPASKCAGVPLVVDPGALGGSPTVYCATTYKNGAEVLQSSGANPGWKGKMLCQLNNLPAECKTSPAAYWSYWYAAAGSTQWTYAVEGAWTFPSKPGQVEGWVFGDGKTPPTMNPADVAAAEALVGSTNTTENIAQPAGSETRTATESDPIGLIIAAVIVIIAGGGVALFTWRRSKSQRETA